MSRGRGRACGGLAAGFALVLGLIAVLIAPVPADAQPDPATGYPRQPVRIIVGFAAGGGNDIQARIIAQKLSERLGQPVVVENRTGAGGNIAAEHVARAAADGYTLLMSPMATVLINPAVYSKLPYDPVASFTPVMQISAFQLFLVVSASSPAKSVADLVAQAKADPAKANYASPASIFQLTTEMFNGKAGVRFEHLPFRGSGEVMTALLNGQATMAFVDPGPLMGHVKEGRVRVLATTGRKRWASLPDAPTMAEVGMPGIEVEPFSVVLAPAGTPAPVVARLETEIGAIIRQPDVIQRFESLGMDVAGVGSAAFAAMLPRELARWKDVARTAGVKLD